MLEKRENRIDNPMHDDALAVGEILPWLELGCWTIVVLAPFLYWVNGPAVSNDQFVVRTSLVTLALIGGFSIRVKKLLSLKVK